MNSSPDADSLLVGRIRAGEGDAWTELIERYDVVMANQSLHHVVELEHLFDAIASAIGDQGIFITSDMIGRNGHQRWPEALAMLQEFWRELPESHRYNLQLRRQEHEFMNWDCSVEGFEGVRAQDILPLLIDRFGFRFFLAFGNLVTPIVDRSFGWYLDQAHPSFAAAQPRPRPPAAELARRRETSAPA